MITVVAALIHSDGKLLVCQRKRGTSFAMMWEFPGGKVKSGETLERSLARELEEELGTSAAIGPEVYRTQHRYAELSDPIELIIFLLSRPHRSKERAQFSLRKNRLARSVVASRVEFPPRRFGVDRNAGERRAVDRLILSCLLICASKFHVNSCRTEANVKGAAETQAVLKERDHGRDKKSPVMLRSYGGTGSSLCSERRFGA